MSSSLSQYQFAAAVCPRNMATSRVRRNCLQIPAKLDSSCHNSALQNQAASLINAKDINQNCLDRFFRWKLKCA